MYSASSVNEVESSETLPDNHQFLLKGALAELAQRTHFPIVFGGFAQKNHVVVTQLVGNRRETLRGLAVRIGWGLGGRVLQEGRPRLTSDYGASRVITHDYDRPVLAEGIKTLFAIPVTVGMSVQAVLYGGLRTSLSIGGVSIDPAVIVAQELAAKLAHYADVAPRVTDVAERLPHGSLGSSALEELRRLYADVRGIAGGLTDPALRAQLEALQKRIANIAAGEWDQTVTTLDRDNLLTAREADVLSLVALGYTNAAVGRTLGVTEATVKSYMNSAMRKLGASTRFEAVAVARHLRLMP